MRNKLVILSLISVTVACNRDGVSAVQGPEPVELQISMGTKMQHTARCCSSMMP